MEILIKIIVSLSIIAFVFMAIYDIYHYEIPDRLTIFLIASYLLVNISLLIANGNQSIELWHGQFFNPLSNLIAGFLYALLFAVIVLITKGKGMGGGDIRIALIVGLVLGINKTILSFYISIFSALIIGIVLILKFRRYKHIKMPFVPFLILGCLVAFFIKFNLYEFMLDLYSF